MSAVLSQMFFVALLLASVFAAEGCTIPAALS